MHPVYETTGGSLMSDVNEPQNVTEQVTPVKFI